MRTLSKIRVSIVVLMLVLAISVACYAAEGKIMIGQTPSTTFPIVISTSGSYVLTSNLQVSSSNTHCIQITADNVTIDLNGFALVGPGTGTGGYGIYVNSADNVTVSNGTVRNFMNVGIYIPSTSHNGQVRDLKAYDNGTHGIQASYSTVINCTAEKNGSDGIYSYHSTVKDCASNDNDDDGIYAYRSTVNDCKCYSNGNRGINASRSSITNCTIDYSTQQGIEATNSTIINCTATNNSGHGIEATNSSITNCTAYDNGYHGIVTTNATVTNCIANSNTSGFYTDSSIIKNCTANNNGYHGVHVMNGNLIEGNTLHNNGLEISTGNGIFFEGIFNLMIKNTAYGNPGSMTNLPVGNNLIPRTGDNANIDWGDLP